MALDEKTSFDAVEDKVPVWYFGRPMLPWSVIALAFGTLLVPVLATVFVPRQPSDPQVLLWLFSLLPALLLAFYRGWRGVAFALAVCMGVILLVQLALIAMGRDIDYWPLLVGVTIAYLCIALGIGFLSELLHRERMRAERLALTDELTGLPNRRYVRLFLETEFAAARRGRPLVVVFFDIDRFKVYNDTHGHIAGDAALRAFADVLRSQTRAMNLSGRYGGEEFIAVLSSSDLPGAMVFVDRVRETLRHAPLDAGTITASAGVAMYSGDMRSPDDLLAAADAALYRAKRNAIDNVEVHGNGGGASVRELPVRRARGTG